MLLDGGVTDTTSKIRHPDMLMIYGPLLLVVGLVLTTGPLDVMGLLVGTLGVAMLTVWMLRRYR